MKRLFDRADGGSFAGNALWLVVRDGYALLTTLVVGVFCARYLGPGGYGLLNYSMSFVILFAAFCQLGLNASVMQALVSKPADAGRVVGSALALHTTAAALSQFGLLAVVSLVGDADGLLLPLTMLHGLTLFFDARLAFDCYFQYRLMSRGAAIAQIAGVTVLCALRAALILVRASILWFALTTVAQSLVGFCVSAALFRRSERLGFSFDWVKRLLSGGVFFMLSGVAAALYSQLDRLMIGGMLTSVDVGWYAVAMFVALAGRFVPDAFIASARPLLLRLAREDAGGFAARFQTLALGTLAVCALLGVALFALGPLALRVVYGAAYAPAGRVLRVLSLAAVFSAANRLRDVYFLAHGLNRYAFAFTLFGAGVNIALNLCLIPLWGVTGAAAATMCAYFVTSFLAPLAFARTRPYARLLLRAPARSRDLIQRIKALAKGGRA